MSLRLELSESYPYVFIKGEVGERLRRSLDREFSYYVAGYERTTEYKEGYWDGRETLLYLSRKGDYFIPIGLLARLKKVLDSLGEDYEVVDYAPRVMIGDLDLDWQSDIELRDYQAEAIQELIKRKGGLISLPTGAGKTVVAIGSMVGFSTSTLIVVHKKELLYQWFDNIKKHLGYEPGMVGDGKKEFKEITVAMMQTLGSLIKSKKITSLNFNMIIFDECHRCPAATCFTIAMRSNARIRVGLSATPRRADGADLKIWASVGEICKSVTPVELVDKGYLAKPNFMFLKPKLSMFHTKTKWHEVYVESIVANEDRNGMIVREAERLIKNGDKVYIHVERIDHGEIIESMLAGCEFVCGKDKMDKRKDILDRFQYGNLQCIVSTLLSEGSDVPEMSAIIMAGGLKSVVGTIQKIGRALRVTETKKEATIIDFQDRGKYISNHWMERYNAYYEYYGKYVPKLTNKSSSQRSL